MKKNIKNFQEEQEHLMTHFRPRAIVREISPPMYEFSFPIDTEISSLDQYDELISILRNASEEDAVVLTINSPGGSLHTAQVIIDEIKESKAFTVAAVAGECASAATMIALACKHLYTTENSSWLFHNMSSFGIGGKNSDVIAFAEHSRKLAIRIAEQHYKDFLPQDVIQNLLKGEEIYMFGDEVMALWEKRQEYLASQQEQCVDGETEEPSSIPSHGQIGNYDYPTEEELEELAAVAEKVKKSCSCISCKCND